MPMAEPLPVSAEQLAQPVTAAAAAELPLPAMPPSPAVALSVPPAALAADRASAPASLRAGVPVPVPAASSAAAAGDGGAAGSGAVPLGGTAAARLQATADPAAAGAAVLPPSAAAAADVALAERRRIIPVGQLTLVAAVGQGSFGRVYKALWRRRTVAVKALFDAALFSEEAQLLSMLSHRNVVRYLGECAAIRHAHSDSSASHATHNHHHGHHGHHSHHPRPPVLDLPRCAGMLVTEFCTGGTLHDRIYADQPIKMENAVSWMLDVVGGLAYLHFEGPVRILHLDLKPLNVLVSSRGVCKLADLGTAMRGIRRGTNNYIEPASLTETENVEVASHFQTRTVTAEDGTEATTTTKMLNRTATAEATAADKSAVADTTVSDSIFVETKTAAADGSAPAEQTVSVTHRETTTTTTTSTATTSSAASGTAKPEAALACSSSAAAAALLSSSAAAAPAPNATEESAATAATTTTTTHPILGAAPSAANKHNVPKWSTSNDNETSSELTALDAPSQLSCSTDDVTAVNPQSRPPTSGPTSSLSNGPTNTETREVSPISAFSATPSSSTAGAAATGGSSHHGSLGSSGAPPLLIGGSGVSASGPATSSSSGAFLDSPEQLQQQQSPTASQPSQQQQQQQQQHRAAGMGDIPANAVKMATRRVHGTVRYMAPELIRGEAVTDRCDVWSFGVLCAEILSRNLPFKEMTNNLTVTYKVGSGNCAPELPEGTPAQLRTIIESCFSAEFGERPPSIQLRHVFEELVCSIPGSNGHAGGVGYSAFKLLQTPMESFSPDLYVASPGSAVSVFRSSNPNTNTTTGTDESRRDSASDTVPLSGDEVSPLHTESSRASGDDPKSSRASGDDPNQQQHGRHQMRNAQQLLDGPALHSGHATGGSDGSGTTHDRVSYIASQLASQLSSDGERGSTGHSPLRSPLTVGGGHHHQLDQPQYHPGPRRYAPVSIGVQTEWKEFAQEFARLQAWEQRLRAREAELEAMEGRLRSERQSLQQSQRPALSPDEGVDVRGSSSLARENSGNTDTSLPVETPSPQQLVPGPHGLVCNGSHHCRTCRGSQPQCIPEEGDDSDLVTEPSESTVSASSASAGGAGGVVGNGHGANGHGSNGHAAGRPSVASDATVTETRLK